MKSVVRLLGVAVGGCGRTSKRFFTATSACKMSSAAGQPALLIKSDLSDMRKPYHPRQEAMRDFPYQNPFVAFDDWFKKISAECETFEEMNGVVLATCTKDGFPSVRVILMKGYSTLGFTFFTNYTSRKGQHLAENPNAALCFYWPRVNKSIRVEGVMEKVSEEESETYWNRRPRGSQASATISEQSTVVEFSGQELDKKITEVEEKFKDKPIPKPETWGGYLLRPRRFEFWAGQTTRLHDRFVFRRKDEEEILSEHSRFVDDGWILERLAP